jgi:hypothetical protein
MSADIDRFVHSCRQEREKFLQQLEMMESGTMGVQEGNRAWDATETAKDMERMKRSVAELDSIIKKYSSESATPSQD